MNKGQYNDLEWKYRTLGGMMSHSPLEIMKLSISLKSSLARFSP